MRKAVGCAVLVVLGGLLALGSTRAEDKKPGDDQDFVKKASAAQLAEINLSLLALKQSTNANVRNFAQTMVNDHQLANKEILALANQKKILVPPTMDAEHKKIEAKLLTLTGAAFDHEYVRHMVQDHEEAVSLFEHESKNGNDKEVQALASKLLPTIRHHLDMARQLSGKDGGGKSRDKNKGGGSD